MKKRIILLRMTAFCLILALLIAGTSYVLERKGSRKRFDPFLKDAERYDVWFLGNSVMVNYLFPLELWEKYGISSYNLASYGNTMPVTYWETMNLLDYAKPKVAVIDVRSVDHVKKLAGNIGDLHTVFDCYPITRTKIKAIEDLMNDVDYFDDDGNNYRDIRWEYYFTLSRYHSRWSELTEQDLNPHLRLDNGGELLINVTAPMEYDLMDDPKPLEEQGWGFDYLHRLITELRNRDIEVVLLSLPFQPKKKHMRITATMETIAESYSVEYLNMIYLDSVTDYSTDLADVNGHANPSGAWKVTDYLGDYLRSRFDLPDRSDDPVLAQRNQNYIDYKLAKLSGIEDAKSMLMMMHDSAVSAAVYIPAGSKAYEDDQMMLLLQNIGREHVLESDDVWRWSNAEFPLEQLDEAREQDAAYLAVFDRGADNVITERMGEESGDPTETSRGTLRISADGKTQSLSREWNGQTEPIEDGSAFDLYVFAVDNRTGEPVVSRGFSL